MADLVCFLASPFEPPFAGDYIEGDALQFLKECEAAVMVVAVVVMAEGEGVEEEEEEEEGMSFDES